MEGAAAPLLAAPAPPKRSVFDNLRRRVFLLLEGQTYPGQCFLAVSFTLSMLSFVLFACEHEPGLEEHHVLFGALQDFTIVFFTFEYLLRLWTCVELLPDVEHLKAGAIIAARICWAVTNFFAIIDLVSLLPYYSFWLHSGTFMNTQWLRVVRILRVLPSLPYGQIWTKSAPLLFAGGFAGFTVWLICACLYYMFERHNPLMEYSPAGDDAGPKDPHWNNFHSIPAAMYFSLLNFGGEFPLIDQHSTGGRFVAMFIQVLGAGVMAIPAGALGSAFGDIVDGDDDDDDDKDDGEDKKDDDKEDDDEAEPQLQLSNDEYIKILDGTPDVMEIPYSESIGGVDAGAFYYALTVFLSVTSVLHFVLDSLTKYPGNLESTVVYLDIFKALGGLVFLAEWIYRVKTAAHFGELYSYQTSTVGLVDFLAVVPILQVVLPTTVWLQGATALRVLKLERYVGAFRTFWAIICQSSTAFMVTGTVALVSWLVFSTLMYFAERHNPDPDMQRYYSSVFTSMWITLLNLSGESPLCQYTVTGKVITSIMAIFGVGFVSIPMGLLGDGFQDKVDDLDGDSEADEKKEDADAAAEAEDIQKAVSIDDGILTKRQKVFKFLQGAAENQIDDVNPWEGYAVRFEQFVILMIFASAVVATLEADGHSDKVDDNTWYQSLFETFVVVLFTVEYCMRYYAAPEDPKWKKAGYVTDSACRFALISSWPAIIDILAILPFYLSMCGSTVADEYDGQLRMLRVFRLLTLDKYIPSVSLIGRVLTNSAEQFKMAGYAMVSLWLVFATILWITERHDYFKVNDLTQAQRYHDVISALPYTLVHLTGDYPLVDYTIQAKIALFFALLFAVGVVSVPAGLLAAGFMRELRVYRAAERKAREMGLNKLQKALKRWIRRRRLMKQFQQAIIKERDMQAKERKLKNQENLQFRVFTFLEGKTDAGKLWGRFMMFLIAANVAAVVGESVPSILNGFGQTFFDLFEFLSVVIFTGTYICNIWVAPLNRKFQMKRENYVFSFWGVVDFITVAPYWLQIVVEVLALFGFPGSEAIAQHAFIFRIVRVLRILQAEDYVESFTLLDEAWFKCKDSMIACGFMAMMVWVLGSVLFYNFEQGNPRMGGAFDTLTSSMYYSMIFLGGEWGLIDFTPAGHVVCVFYCVVGIALYGIPVGALFDAFSDVLEDRNSADGGEGADS